MERPLDVLYRRFLFLVGTLCRSERGLISLDLENNATVLSPTSPRALCPIRAPSVKNGKLRAEEERGGGIGGVLVAPYDTPGRTSIINKL